MTAHPNAHIIAQLAEIAKTDPEPWRRLERESVAAGDWFDCGPHIALLHPDVVLRIKPATVKLGGVGLEGPLREAPEDGTKLWLLFDSSAVPSIPVRFTASQASQIKWLKEGRLFASKEARDKYQDALVNLAMGETK